MFRTSAFVIALTGAVGVFPLAAADLPAKAPPAQIGFSWTGFYAGLNYGTVVGQSHASSVVPSNAIVAGADVNKAGLMGGVQAGFNWQVGPAWLVGLEGDIGYLGIDQSNIDWFDAITIGEKASWFGTVRGRTGYIAGPSLLYVTGGLASIRLEDTFGGNTVTGLAPATSTAWRTGWTVGGGIETRLSGNWSTKTEYLYIDTGTHSFAANPYGVADVASFSSQFHVVKTGLNYNFGYGSQTFPAELLRRDWAGFYVGANLGIGLSATHITGVVGPRGDADINGRGFTGGFQAGYNWMLGPKWFVGVEGDIGYLGIDRSFQDWADDFEFKQKTSWYGTLRGRVGANTGAALLYVTAGGAAVRAENAITFLSLNNIGSSTETATGWTIGGGTEVALNSRWSAKLETLYIDVGHQLATTTNIVGVPRGIDFDRRFQVVRAGLNYRLGGAN